MRVGVIVPVHGFAPYLAEALDSVRAEGPDEVVVVDDGSPSLPVAGGDACGGRSAAGRRRRARPGWRRSATATSSRCATPTTPGARAACAPSSPRSATPTSRSGARRSSGPDGRPTGERWEPIPAGPFVPPFDDEPDRHLVGAACAGRRSSAPAGSPRPFPPRRGLGPLAAAARCRRDVRQRAGERRRLPPPSGRALGGHRRARAGAARGARAARRARDRGGAGAGARHRPARPRRRADPRAATTPARARRCARRGAPGSRPRPLRAPRDAARAGACSGAATPTGARFDSRRRPSS